MQHGMYRFSNMGFDSNWKANLEHGIEGVTTAHTVFSDQLTTSEYRLITNMSPLDVSFVRLLKGRHNPLLMTSTNAFRPPHPGTSLQQVTC